MGHRTGARNSSTKEGDSYFQMSVPLNKTSAKYFLPSKIHRVNFKQQFCTLNGHCGKGMLHKSEQLNSFPKCPLSGRVHSVQWPSVFQTATYRDNFPAPSKASTSMALPFGVSRAQGCSLPTGIRPYNTEHSLR